MFSKQEILEYLSKNKKASYLEIAKALKINKNKNKEFSKYLSNLKKEGDIFFSFKNNYYYVPKFIGTYEVEIKTNINNKLFCFIDLNNQSIKVSIFDNSLHVLKNDLVSVNVYQEIDGEFYTGIIREIIKRKNEFIYVQVDDNLNILPLFFNQEIKLKINNKDKLKPNTFAKLKINKIEKDNLILDFDETLNDLNKPYADIDLIVDYFNVKKNFDNETINESLKIEDEVKNVKDFNRIDLTEKMIVTIDGEKTKDFDDAISVTKNEDGTYLLGVHIADVAYYVQENSSLDLEARQRGTSIYLINKVIPMLPEKLSNGICSLNPNVKRFTLTLEAKIDKNGFTLDHKIYPSMIESKYRLTYNQVANMENENFIKENKDLYSMLKHAYELSEILSRKKENEGYIDFEIEEPIIELDPKSGKTIAIKNRQRLSSEILIENFMVFANETVSKTIADLQIPSIYRVHEAPSIEKIDSLKSFLKAIGINDVKVKESDDPKDFQETVNELKKERFDNLVKMSLLRTMQKAEYSINNIGHFGLASHYYSHFTSPIRRYPDLLLHRIIWEVLIKKNHDYSIKRKELIDAIAKHSSKTEVVATDLERKTNDIKKAEFYESKINEIKEATIVSIVKFGMFVEFDDSTNSLIHISTITNNKDYEISNDLCRLMVNNKIYQVGQKIKVKITKISKFDGKIDSVLI